MVGVAVAAAALAGAAAGGRVIDRQAADGAAAELARLAKAAAARAHDALFKVELEEARAQVRVASLIQSLRSEVGTGDAQTLKQDLKSEIWWKDVRREWPVYSILIPDAKVEVTEGIEKADLLDEKLVSDAAVSGHPEADVIMGRGWPFIGAAAAVKPPQGAPGTLVLAKPIRDDVLAAIAKATSSPVALTTATTTIAAGPEPGRKLLREAAAGKLEGLIVAPDQAWAAAAAPVAPGVVLWAHVAAVGGDAAKSAATTKAVLWGAAGLLALLGLVFGVRRPSGDDKEILVRKLAETQAELQRVSGMTSQQAAPATATPASVTGTGETQAAGRSAPGLPAALATARTQAMGAAAPAPPIAGGAQSFGRYTLVDRLGEGGMAEVYTAVTFGAEGFKRTFVVKRLRAELARDPNVVAQFIDEANLASTLVHSNIIPVFDFGKVGDEYYLAQEYILGRDLARLTRRVVERTGKPLTVAPALHVVHETLRALEYAHGKTGEGGKPLGIVHRDVSPNNILVSARGEVKLFDFGIVKAEGRVTKTEHGIVKGNVSFMSPEQARGLAVDARADLFSLGLCLYYALAGEVLYRGETTYELLVKAATGPGPEETARIMALPEPAPRILVKALQSEVRSRYQTAAEFAAAIASYAGGQVAELGRLMQTMFGADFKQEEASFAAAVPAAPAPATPPAGTTSAGTGTRSFDRRS